MAAVSLPDLALAREAAGLLPEDDAYRRTALLMAAARDGQPLDRDLLGEPLPVDLARAAAAVILAALARDPAQASPPAWLMTRPERAGALYAWGLLRLRQGAVEDGVAALGDAAAARPDLGFIRDAASAARVSAAAGALRRGDLPLAEQLTSAVKDGPLAARAAELRVLATAGDRGDDALLNRARRDPLAIGLVHELTRRRARALLLARKHEEARVLLATLPADEERAFLEACLALDSGDPPQRVLARVSSALAGPPPHLPSLAVLEVELGLRDESPRARAAALERLRESNRPSLAIDLALARERLDDGDVRGAKRLLFPCYRELAAPRPRALDEQIRAALAREAEVRP